MLTKKKLPPIFIFFTFVLLFFLLDQFSKELARNFLVGKKPIVLIPKILELIYIENTGISWGIFNNLSEKIRFWVLFVLPFLFVLAMCYYVIKNWVKLFFSQKAGWILIVGGALGNLYDRAIFQSVTDFMHFRFFSISFFVNNLADDFISIGFFCILWHDIKQVFKKKK